ncbi:MAG: HAMP domain-containing protein [Myxococcales bacterium]|nr:HAMP domain-containing protein [Myxococcales bacterium]
MAGADALVLDLMADVQARRADLAGRRYNLLYVLGLALIVGLGVIVGLLIFFIAAMEQDVSELKEVARALERGDLIDRPSVEHGTHELAEVGRAFNRLSTTLASVRARQTAYNRIVTGLNRNVYLHETIRLSLAELARADSRGRPAASS